MLELQQRRGGELQQFVHCKKMTPLCFITLLGLFLLAMCHSNCIKEWPFVSNNLVDISRESVSMPSWRGRHCVKTWFVKTLHWPVLAISWGYEDVWKKHATGTATHQWCVDAKFQGLWQAAWSRKAWDTSFSPSDPKCLVASFLLPFTSNVAQGRCTRPTPTHQAGNVAKPTMRHHYLVDGQPMGKGWEGYLIVTAMVNYGKYGHCNSFVGILTIIGGKWMIQH